MPRRREGDRVIGLYEEGKRWRVVLIEKGQRESRFAPDEASARRLAAQVRRQQARRATSRRVADVIEEWARDKVATGRCKPETTSHQSMLLRGFLSAHLEADVQELTPQRAAQTYERRVQQPCPRTGRPPAVATQRFVLQIAKDFGSWSARRGYLKRSPFVDIRPVGRPNAGKPQLRIDEARRFLEAAFAYFEETGHPLAVGALLALLMGLRTSEALLRQVRDLDDGGRVLWIPSGKSKNARRRLVVPELLRPALLALCEGKGGDEPIFSVRDDKHGGHRSTMWLVVRRICRRAGVPCVCPHSLRGLHSTLALEAGVTANAVASALGHGSFAMTARHYAAPGTLEGLQARRVVDVLGGAHSADRLQQVDDETLRELLALIAERKRSGNDPKGK